MTEPQPFDQAPRAELAKIRGVCLDIDDTLSTAGKLTAEAYAALWELKQAGFAVVPITGRPAGWCDHFARFWPVDAIVGENGGFVFYMKDGVRRRMDTLPEKDAAAARSRIGGLEKTVRAAYPQARWASDQGYREYDLAIDVCEDVPAWGRAEVDALLKLCHDQGAHAKLSSIHVNAWFGDYDKVSGFRHLLSSQVVPGLPPEAQWLYIGDSPNDEPMFKAFSQTSVGVANLAQYLDRLKHPPRWITRGSSGQGFAEMARALIASR